MSDAFWTLEEENRTQDDGLRGSLGLAHFSIISGVNWEVTTDGFETFIQYLIFLNFVIQKSFTFANTHK